MCRCVRSQYFSIILQGFSLHCISLMFDVLVAHFFIFLMFPTQLNKFNSTDGVLLSKINILLKAESHKNYQQKSYTCLHFFEIFLVFALPYVAIGRTQCKLLGRLGVPDVLVTSFSNVSVKVWHSQCVPSQRFTENTSVCSQILSYNYRERLVTRIMTCHNLGECVGHRTIILMCVSQDQEHTICRGFRKSDATSILVCYPRQQHWSIIKKYFFICHWKDSLICRNMKRIKYQLCTKFNSNRST